MSNYIALKALAECAYPGPWYVENGMDQVRDNADDFVCETGEDDPVNSAYIAAANPAAVLELIAENDRLKRELAVAGVACTAAVQVGNAALAEIDEDKLHFSAMGSALEGVVAERDRLKSIIANQSVRRFVGQDDQRAIDDLVATGIRADQELIAELKAECEGLRADAGRYRWLLKNASVILDSKTAYQAETGFIKFDTMPGRMETELAIDASMREGERS